MRPTATTANWRDIGKKIHAWFMKDMKISRYSRDEVVFLALALCGEAGELANFVKKSWRDQDKLSGAEYSDLMQKIHMEMADIQGYLVHLADAMQINLEEVTARKTNELIDRWPQIWEEKA